jgi:hypothetical protein
MRKGIIKITDDIIKNDWGTLHIFFKDFRPTHIEFRHWENDVWYFYGVSDLFDELKEAESVPFYDVVFTRIGGSFTYKFNRI